jgi:glycosyltransferase involved in cell wall biosynthesis
MRDSDPDIARVRILMTADAVGGVWQYSLDLIEHLVTLGAEVRLATMGPRPNEAQKQRISRLRGATLIESDYKLEWMHQPWEDVDQAGEWLLRQAAEFRPDVIHLNGYAHAALNLPAPVLVVAHSCVYSWWNAVHGCAPPQDEWTEYHNRVSAGLRAADAVVTPSSFMASELTQAYGLPKNRVRVIHNFSQSTEFDSRSKESLFLAAGRIWDTGKNLQLLESIAGQLPWPMQIAGNLTHQAVLDTMQRASVYVHSALYEPFGLAVLEAARAQCCLVLSDIASLRELWNDAALFVDARDPTAWVDALTIIANGRERREALAKLARQRATQYSAAATVRQYCDIYRSLTECRSAAA